MNHSKPGLNEPFYRWLDEVRRAIRTEQELKEKLEYYNVKLVGYKGVVYDRIGSVGTAGNEMDIYYWMDKIKITEDRISQTRYILNDLQILQDALDEYNRHVLSKILTYQKGGIKGSLWYKHIDDIIRMWSKIVNSNS